jgi:hypothetical protein
MGAIRPSAIETVTRMWLIAPNGVTLPVEACFRYDPKDPYAITVVFQAETTDGSLACWVFGRELLAAGLDKSAGLGDVRLKPRWRPWGRVVMFSLSAPDGQARLKARRRVLARLLEQAYSLVPRGEESDHLDIDGCIAKLLAKQT